LRNSLSHFQANHIQDSGWLDYQVRTCYKNGMYSSDGFNCGIRQIQYLYGNPDTGIKYVTQKMIRVNIRNFTDGQQIAQIPTNFTKYAQVRSEEHTSELQSRFDLVCRLLLEKKKQNEKHEAVIMTEKPQSQIE